MPTGTTQLYAEVALPNALRQTFSYSVPAGLEVEPGHRVGFLSDGVKPTGMWFRSAPSDPMCGGSGPSWIAIRPNGW